MRASRLISILLLLQARGRLTADALAQELEVSVRTIYRDIEALHQSGVALYGEPGRDGGYQLVDGYRTQLTGLTRDEARALSLAGLPAAAGDLGLGPEAAGAAAKLTAALSDEQRRRADEVRQRLHIDSSAWYGELDPAPLLPAVADALWRQQQLRIHYQRWREPSPVERTVDPLGLVHKTGRWYLVARAADQVRTYRMSNLDSVEPTGARFDRPENFDLAGHWRAYLADFAQRRHPLRAVLRISPEGRQRIATLMESVIVHAVAETAGPPDPDGWVEASIPIESIHHAHRELLRLGAGVEVLAPVALRDELRDTAAALAKLYGA
jgi:predicted DNA-binding transcriptional regulator YafY